MTIKPTIDRVVVKENIDRFIQEGASFTIYVEAPPFKSIASILVAQKMDQDMGYGGSITLTSVLFSKPSTVITGIHLPDIMRSCHKTEIQANLICREGEQLMQLADTWHFARYYKEHPEDEIKGWKRIFSPVYWFQTKQEHFDKLFSEDLSKAYEWLQEQDPLKQRDLKLTYAVAGLYRLDKYNQRYTKTKALFDEFVAEQIRRVPHQILANIRECGFKWVNGNIIVDFDCTVYNLYKDQIQEEM